MKNSLNCFLNYCTTTNKEVRSILRILHLKRSEEHTSELHHQIISYAVFCLKKKKKRYTETSRVDRPQRPGRGRHAGLRGRGDRTVGGLSDRTELRGVSLSASTLSRCATPISVSRHSMPRRVLLAFLTFPAVIS